MIRAILIDDEEVSLKGLSQKIKKHCPDINVIKLFSRPAEAVQEIQAMKPDVVFLDIEMPKMNGFTLLTKCSPVNFEVIFTTAYSAYAIDALRISALDFLLKPIDIKELIAAVQRLEEKLKQKHLRQDKLDDQLQLFLQYRQAPNQFDKIALPMLTGLEFVTISDIIKIEGDNVYSIFYLKGNKKVVVCRTLMEIEKMIERWNFMRIHKSYIINLNYVSQYIKGEGGLVILSDGSEVAVSRRNKPEFLRRINR